MVAVKQPKKKKQKRHVPLIDLTSPSPSPPSAAPAEPEEKLDWVKELEEAAGASSEDDPGYDSEGYVASVHMTPDEMRHTIRVMERGLAYYATRMAKNFEDAFPGATIRLPAGATAALSDSSDSEGEGEKKKKKKKKKKAAATKMDVDQPPTT